VTTYHPQSNLKILLVSTPKTGNTWLKYLLAAIYDLPIIEFPMPEHWSEFDQNRYNELGPRWIAHQHVPPLDPLVRWAHEQRVTLITTVRHPGDSLVSMYYYVQNYTGTVMIDPEAIRLLISPEGKKEQAGVIPLTQGLELYVRNKFFYSLNYSIAWLHSGLSFGVRYEDLWDSPLRTLQALTNCLQPVDSERIRDAILQCHIDVLRVRGQEGQAFYRAGGVGVWKTSLPAAIIKLLRESPPYALQFRWLNYKLDIPRARRSKRVFASRLNRLPFLDESDLDWLTAQIYSSFAQERQAVARGDCDSMIDDFCKWLNAPVDKDPQRGRTQPVITNLGAYLYRDRRDLQKAFPDLYGRDRAAFSHWFVEYVPIEYPELDTTFVARVCESWVQGPAPTFSPVHLPKEQTLFNLTPRKCHPAGR